MRQLLLLAPLLFLTGCQARDADILGQVIDRTHQKFNQAVGDAPLRMAGKLRGTIADAGIVSRVHLRLVWDRYLEGIEMLVENPNEGVVKIRCTVPNLAAKQRVVDLAKATKGVTKVIEEITVTSK